MAVLHALVLGILLQLLAKFSCNVLRQDRPFQCRELYTFDATKHPTGDMYSPFYENGSYPTNLWCEYQIIVPAGYRVKLTFKDFDLEPSYYCSNDKLVVYGNKQEYIINTYCGREIPKPLITNGDLKTVHFLFLTDMMVGGRGYHLHYEIGKTFEVCPSGHRLCKNGECFDPNSQLCDGTDNCGDGTDEEDCKLPVASVECGKPPIVPDTIYGDVERIIGGKEVIPGSWPWQVSLQYRWSPFSHGCGGSLINAEWLVTAAHCFKFNPAPDNWRIQIGDHDKFKKDKYEQIRYGKRIVVYPDITSEGNEGMKGKIDMTNDIALIKLNAPVQFNDGVQPACLPQLGWEIRAGITCYVTGWGETRGTGSDHALKQTDVNIMPLANCSFYEKTQICVKNKAGFQSTCHGDSGGPLACRMGGRWYVVGADSFGTHSNFISGLCAMPNQRTVFTKLADKRHWIDTMIEKYS